MKWLVTSLAASTVITGMLGIAKANAIVNVEPKFAVSTLRLPNGKTLTNQTANLSKAKYKDLEISLQVIGVPQQYPYGLSVVGNHSEILSQYDVETSSGKAWFALNKRTSPSAVKSTKATYEYWAAIERTSLTTSYSIDYCIEATVIGNRAKAKQEFIALLSSWKVPANANSNTNMQDDRLIIKTLTKYLDAFNIGNLPKAYSMFADIAHHMSLKQWKTQGDPQKGWRPVVKRIHVIEKDNLALVYMVATILPPTVKQRRIFIFVYPMIKQNNVWKMVYDEADFGLQNIQLFNRLNTEMQSYAQKQHGRL